MGLLDSFEKGLERAVNSAFAKTFRSGIQPVEIASALRSELDKKAAVVSRDRILAPNTLHRATLARDDDERMRALGDRARRRAATLSCTKHAKAQGYSFAGPVAITLERDEELATGTLRVESRHGRGPRRVARRRRRRGQAAPARHAPHGHRPRQRCRHHDLRRRHEPQARRDPVGRRARHGARPAVHQRHEAQRPARSSRPHSTPDSTMTIGRTDIVFRVVAQARAARSRRCRRMSTRAFDVHGGGPLR